MLLPLNGLKYGDGIKWLDFLFCNKCYSDSYLLNELNENDELDNDDDGVDDDDDGVFDKDDTLVEKEREDEQVLYSDQNLPCKVFTRHNEYDGKVTTSRSGSF